MQRKHFAWVAGAATIAAVFQILAPAESAAPAAAPSAARPTASTSSLPSLSPLAVGGTSDTAGSHAAAPAEARPDPTRPRGVSAEQWQQVREALAEHSDRDAELARIGAFLSYQSDVERLRELRERGSTRSAAETAELRALAQSIDAGLPDRLARNELTAGEALALRSAVLEALQDGDTASPVQVALRQQQLLAWGQDLARRAQAAHKPDLREQRFGAEQAALVAAWQARPEAQRDPRELEQALEALRQRSFPAQP